MLVIAPDKSDSYSFAMAQPSPYVRETNFTDFSAQFPASPQRGDSLDAEFNGIETTLEGVLRSLALIQRDDGQLLNESVNLDQLHPVVKAALGGGTFKVRSEGWAVDLALNTGDIVAKDNTIYLVTQTHIATDILTDQAAGHLSVMFSQGYRDAPRRLSYAPPRWRAHTLRTVLDRANAIHLDIVGYAANAGTTGGFGKTVFYVDNESSDPSTPNSFWYAVDQYKAAGGGMIVFDGGAHFNIDVPDRNDLNVGDLTICAPGRNVTFWHTSLRGTVNLMNTNIVLWGLEARTKAGALATYDDSTGTKGEIKLWNLDPHLCDRIAVMNCDFRRASDGALDMTSSLLVAASPQCRVTVQDCIFWDTDQPMMVGSGDPLCTNNDPEKLLITLYNCIFAYCGERQPKVLGRCFVDMVDCYTLTLPFQRDQLAPTNEFSACYGADALTGGKLRARGCLWQAADGVTGYAALQVAVDTSGRDGAVDAIDCGTDDGMTITTGNVARIPAIPYVLAHTPVPAGAGPRKDWIADRWARAGAKVDPAPEGLFSWTADTTHYPNGDTVLIDRDLGGRWVRVDARADMLMDGEGEGAVGGATLDLPRGNTIQIVNDTITIDPDNSVMTITPETGSADTLKTILGGTDGRVIILKIGSAITMTVSGGGAAGGAIDIAENITMDRRGRSLALIYLSGLWTVLSSNERVTAAVQTLLNAKLDSANFTWALLGGKPATFPPSAHTHVMADITNLPTLAGAEYVPTVAAVLNCSAPTAQKCRYSRNGNHVIVSGQVTVTTTAVGEARVSVSLPVIEDFTVADEVAGTCGSVRGCGFVWGDTAGDVLVCDYQAASAGSTVIRFVATYILGA